MALRTIAEERVPEPGRLRRLLGSDLLYSFRRSPLAILAAVVTLGLVAGAVLAPWIAPQDPFDPANLDLLNSLLELSKQQEEIVRELLERKSLPPESADRRG